jgi:hypothetical protein
MLAILTKIEELENNRRGRDAQFQNNNKYTLHADAEKTAGSGSKASQEWRGLRRAGKKNVAFVLMLKIKF